MYIFDTHQDITDAMLYSTRTDFWREHTLHEGSNELGLPVNNQTDFVRLKKGNIKGVFAVTCAVGVDSSKKSDDPASCIIPAPDHLRESLRHISKYHQLRAESNGKIQFIERKSDLESIEKYDVSFVMAMEGADSITESLVELETYFNLGVRSIGLTWSYTNGLAGGCNDTDTELTETGKKAIRRMNELGIILDLAHINEKSFYQALEVSTRPAIISHTASKVVYNHPRNVTDEQLKVVADTGGAIGIFGIPRMIGDHHNEQLTVEHIFNHIDHVVNVVGIDHVMLGPDFGTMLDSKLIPGFEQVTDIENLLNIMREKGYRAEDMEKIAHKNIERVLREVLPE